jgi:zinc transport system ATP-binding protein
MDLRGVLALSKKPYRILSGGQRQRTLLARALCATDSILLLDEPVTGLDPQASGEMYAIIKTLSDRGVAIVTVSHDMRGALRDAKHVLVMDNAVGRHLSVEDYKREVGR